MKRTMLVVLFSFLAACGCRKNHHPRPEQPSSPDDSRSVLLKELIVQHIPSPYFHFTYDAEKFVTRISFLSGQITYDVQYSGRRVKQMVNINSGNTLLYTYDGPHVSEISELSSENGKQVFSYRFSYNEKGQMKEALWYEFPGNAPFLFKKVTFAYYPDGNLASIERYRDSSGYFNWSSKEVFSDYDNKTNVDDFYLLKTEMFESYLFLPRVRFQHNNPRMQKSYGVLNDYEISYTYQYTNNLPTTKTGNLLQTRGVNKGFTQQNTHRFNYY